MKFQGLKVFVIDDNPDDILVMSRLIKKLDGNAAVSSSASGNDALLKIKNEPFSVIFVDMKMPGMDGLELLNKITEVGCRTPVIIVTGQGDEKAAVNAMKAGAYDYIIKDELNLELLHKTIFHALEKRELEDDKDRLEKELLLYANNLEKMVKDRTLEVEYLNSYKELILSTIHDYIRVVDPFGKVVQYESIKIRNRFGNNVGKPCYSFWGKTEICENCISRKAIEESSIQEKEEFEDGRRYHVIARPLKNRDGSMSAVEVITDITEKRSMEEELERNRRYAVMGEISAHLAHEIRNPIHKITMGAGFLRESAELSPTTENIINIISNAASSLERLVNNILDFSRPQKPNWEKTDIIRLLEDLYSETISLHDNQGVTFFKNLPAKVLEAWVDPVKFKSIIKNILLNGAQSIEQKGEVRVFASAKDNDFIEIVISDTGKGIAEKEIKKIFDPFYTTKTKGTGLGMSIVAKFVEMHHGTIDIKSTVGKGTEVTLKMPLITAQP